MIETGDLMFEPVGISEDIILHIILKPPGQSTGKVDKRPCVHRNTARKLLVKLRAKGLITNVRFAKNRNAWYLLEPGYDFLGWVPSDFDDLYAK